MRFKKAIKRVMKELREEEGYYYSWQANIACAFQDACRQYKKKNNKKALSNGDIYKISNTAAKEFLNLLIREVNK